VAVNHWSWQILSVKNERIKPIRKIKYLVIVTCTSSERLLLVACRSFGVLAVQYVFVNSANVRLLSIALRTFHFEQWRRRDQSLFRWPYIHLGLRFANSIKKSLDPRDEPLSESLASRPVSEQTQVQKPKCSSFCTVLNWDKIAKPRLPPKKKEEKKVSILGCAWSNVTEKSKYQRRWKLKKRTIRSGFEPDTF
jgi:hypothetical protein